jgi:ferredoxin-NADP reductase
MSQLNFTPGQYLEWTYPHKHPDSRGVRRYFSLSSSPKEKLVKITMKISDKPSSFKKSLSAIKPGSEVLAGSPKGEFLLPERRDEPLAFIAGGIGITPFVSMLKSMVESGETRDIILLYANRNNSDIAFKDILEKAKQLGVKTIFINTEKDGHINQNMIEQNIPDYPKRVFYISGPAPMVTAIQKMLKQMKIRKIKTDFFPGYEDKVTK